MFHPRSAATGATALLLAATLAGCATGNPQYQQVKDDAKGVQSAKPCCDTLAAALATASAFPGKTTTFGASTRHFDLGHGLAPFIAVDLPADTRKIEVDAPLQLLGWAYGGDGEARYVEVEALFFTAGGRALPAREGERGQRFTADGGRSLFQYFGVPDGATRVIFTTDPTRNGTRNFGPIHARIDAPATARTPVLFPGGLLPYGYQVASYGPVGLRALPNE